MDGLWARKSEGVGLSVQVVSKISNLCGPDSPTLQTDRQTDRRHAIAILHFAIVHSAIVIINIILLNVHIADEVGRDGRLTRTWFSLPDCTINDPRAFTARIQAQVDE